MILFLVCVFAQAAHLPGNCSFDGEILTVGEHIRGCSRIICYAEGTVAILECPLFYCPEETQIGYRNMDPSKSFPECCEGPICKRKWF